MGDGNSTVKVFDVAGCDGTTAPKQTISTGNAALDRRADEMCYDPVDQLIMVANNAPVSTSTAPRFPFATLISTLGPTYVPVAKIPFDGTNGAPKSTNGIEQCQWSPVTGKFYIAIPGIVGAPAGGGGVAVIDPKSMKVEKTFLISGDVCMAPQGMAIGPDNQILLGCNGASGNGTFSTVIINQHTGAVVAVLANESGADEVWFNPGDDHYFLARSAAHGPNQMLGVVDALGHRADQSVVTANKTIAGRNAHSVAADSNKNQVYVPIPAGVSTVCSAAGG